MKKIIKLFLITLFTFLLTGCFKSEELDNAEVYTTVYPVEYIVNELYGHNSEVKSIYPVGVNINNYELSNTKIKKYSKADLFVYCGVTDEKQLAANFLNHNGNLKIIDASEYYEIKHSYEEVWFDPSIYLWLAQNTKNGLERFIRSSIIKEEIEKNYENLKVTISEFETTLKLLSQNGKYTTLIFSKDYFKYLENYGFEVISLEENENLTNDIINRAKNLINNKNNKYVYVTDIEANNEKYSDTIEALKEAGAEIKVINTMAVLNAEQRESNENYVTIMKSNIELLKEEINK